MFDMHNPSTRTFWLLLFRNPGLMRPSHAYDFGLEVQIRHLSQLGADTLEFPGANSEPGAVFKRPPRRVAIWDVAL